MFPEGKPRGTLRVETQKVKNFPFVNLICFAVINPSVFLNNECLL